MGEREDMVRADIERKYGSIPKMAGETGVAKNTIYHALERGLDNTTTKTRQAILRPLYGEKFEHVIYSAIDLGDVERKEWSMSADELDFIEKYRALDGETRKLVRQLVDKLSR